MSVIEQAYGVLRKVLMTNEAVERMAQGLTATSAELDALTETVRDLDRRLIRVEAALEMATTGQFRAPGPPNRQS